MIPSPFRIVEITLYSMLTFLPFVAMIFFPARAKLRFPPVVTALFMVVLAVGHLAADVAAGLELYADSDLLILASILAHGLIYLLIFRQPFGWTLFTWLSVMNLAVFITTAAKCLEGLLFPDSAQGIFGLTYLFMLLAVEALVMISSLMAVRKFSMVFRFPKLHWNIAWLLPAACTAFWYIYMYLGLSFTDTWIALRPVNTLVLFAVNLVFAVVCFKPGSAQAEEAVAADETIDEEKAQRAAEKAEARAKRAAERAEAKAKRAAERAEAKARREAEKAAQQAAAAEAAPAGLETPEEAAPAAESNETAPAEIAPAKANDTPPAEAASDDICAPAPDPQEYLLRVQTVQHVNMLEKMAESRRVNQNLQLQLNMLEESLAKNDFRKLRDQLHTFQTLVPKVNAGPFCEHATVNALLQYYAQSAKSYGIVFNAEVQIPNEITVRSRDLTVLLGNLLDNAMDACRSQKSFNRHITVTGSAAENAVHFVIENTFESPVRQSEDGVFLSTKHSGSGIGIEIAKEITRRYQGVLEFEMDNNLFKASVTLNS